MDDLIVSELPPSVQIDTNITIAIERIADNRDTGDPNIVALLSRFAALDTDVVCSFSLIEAVLRGERLTLPSLSAYREMARKVLGVLKLNAKELSALIAGEEISLAPVVSENNNLSPQAAKLVLIMVVQSYCALLKIESLRRLNRNVSAENYVRFREWQESTFRVGAYEAAVAGAIFCGTSRERDFAQRILSPDAKEPLKRLWAAAWDITHLRMYDERPSEFKKDGFVTKDRALSGLRRVCARSARLQVSGLPVMELDLPKVIGSQSTQDLACQFNKVVHPREPLLWEELTMLAQELERELGSSG